MLASVWLRCSTLMSVDCKMLFSDLLSHSSFVGMRLFRYWTPIMDTGSLGQRLLEPRATVLVCDSLPPAMTMKLRNQIACLLCTSESIIKANYIDAEMQDDSADCGVFALAFLSTLASGGKPCAMSLCQEDTRRHLANCLERNSLGPFPIKLTRRNGNKLKGAMIIPVYCTCRLPALNDCNMTECSKCNVWYHM